VLVRALIGAAIVPPRLPLLCSTASATARSRGLGETAVGFLPAADFLAPVFVTSCVTIK
jgi:hypothetical protein